MGSQIYTFTSTSTQTVGEDQRQFLDVPYVKLTLALNSVFLIFIQLREEVMIFLKPSYQKYE